MAPERVTIPPEVRRIGARRKSPGRAGTPQRTEGYLESSFGGSRTQALSTVGCKPRGVGLLEVAAFEPRRCMLQDKASPTMGDMVNHFHSWLAAPRRFDQMDRWT